MQQDVESRRRNRRCTAGMQGWNRGEPSGDEEEEAAGPRSGTWKKAVRSGMRVMQMWSWQDAWGEYLVTCGEAAESLCGGVKENYVVADD